VECSTGVAFPQFKGNYFWLLARDRLIRVTLDGRRVLSQEDLITKYGRIRDVAEGQMVSSTSRRRIVTDAGRQLVTMIEFSG
jgi:hypothetical protein